MNKEQARLYVRERMDEYLSTKGIDTKKPFRCLNPSHVDKHPSMSYDRKRKKVHCFSCGVDYDTFDLIAIDYNLQEGAQIFKKAYDYFGVSLTENDCRRISEYIIHTHSNVSGTDYFHKRGLSDSVIRQFLLGYDDNYKWGTSGKTWKAVIIPTGASSFTARNTDPNADKNNRIRKSGGIAVFNFDNAINSPGPIFVVEGEMDALSIIEAGGNAIALGSTVNCEKAMFFLKGWVFKSSDEYNKKRYRPIIVSMDNDTEGRNASEKLLNGLRNVFSRCMDINVSLGYKDANEALIRDRDAFINNIQKIVKRFDEIEVVEGVSEIEYPERYKYRLQHSSVFYLDTFFNDKDCGYYNTSTGFSKLDAAFGRGLVAGLYIIGAISSLGKTTFALQMADNIAADGNDVLIFSLEMSKRELIAKSISRHTLLKCLSEDVAASSAKSALDIMSVDGYKDTVLKCAVDVYAEYAANVYFNESVSDIEDLRKAVEGHISITGKRPVIFVDYIQILNSGNIRGTDKQHMDRNVTELKRISRDFKIPVIGISSFNRQSYRESVTMEAFKESGAIEYSSDVLIGLQLSGAGKKDFDGDKEKMKNPRTIELKILKNRNGCVGDVVLYHYYPEFNYFKEL